MNVLIESKGDAALLAEAEARPLIDGEPHSPLSVIRGGTIIGGYIAVIDRAKRSFPAQARPATRKTKR